MMRTIFLYSFAFLLLGNQAEFSYIRYVLCSFSFSNL